MKLKHKQTVGLLFILVCTLLIGAGIIYSSIIADHATNEVNRALSPFTIEDCTTVKMYTTTTNEVAPSELKPGDTVVAIIDIPMSVVSSNTNPRMGENIVGFIKFTVPDISNNPPNVDK